MLDLGYNELTGSIPPELGSLTHLHTLDFLGNGLTGCIPRALSDDPDLQLETDGLPPCR